MFLCRVPGVINTSGCLESVTRTRGTRASPELRTHVILMSSSCHPHDGILMSFSCHPYVILMMASSCHSLVIPMSSYDGNLMSFSCHPYVILMPSLCPYMSSSCHLYVITPFDLMSLHCNVILMADVSSWCQLR